MANKALIIDSSESVRRLASAFLKAEGYEVQTIDNGLEALERVKGFKPSLVLLDMSLTGMGDLSLLRKILEVDSGIHVVLMTSNPNDRSTDKAREMGVQQFIVKGPGITAFAKTLEACLRPQEKKAPSGAVGRPHPIILVVDDEEPIRNLLKRFLEKKGYEVQTAPNGAEALKMIGQNKPALALLDINMPGISGLELLEKIRGLAPDIGVMMITGNKDEEVARECMRRGAFDYIGKPFNFDYLENSVMAKILLVTS